MRTLLLIPLLLLTACASPDVAETIETPDDLIAAMQARYAGNWYETLTFEQETIQYRADGSADTATWHEALQVPGRLRIDIGDRAEGNGLIFRNDSLFSFQNGLQVNAQPTIHPLLLLGFDVYFLSPEAVQAGLDSLGFDRSVMHQTIWQDRPVYVVGAAEGDLSAPQFWVDQKHLYFVRLLQPVGPGGVQTQDVRFNSYERQGGGWVAPEVLFYVDSTLVMVERYKDVQTGVRLDEALFDPDRW